MRRMVPNVRDVTDASKGYFMTAVDQYGNTTSYDWTSADHRQVVTNIRNQLDEYSLLLGLPALASDPVQKLTASERVRVVMAQVGIGAMDPTPASAAVYNAVHTLCMNAQQSIDDGDAVPGGYADHAAKLLRRRAPGERVQHMEGALARCRVLAHRLV